MNFELWGKVKLTTKAGFIHFEVALEILAVKEEFIRRRLDVEPLFLRRGRQMKENSVGRLSLWLINLSLRDLPSRGCTVDFLLQ